MRTNYTKPPKRGDVKYIKPKPMNALGVGFNLYSGYNPTKEDLRQGRDLNRTLGVLRCGW